MIESALVLQTAGGLVREVLPDWTTPVFLGITRLGNVAFFLVLFVFDYWFADHERGAHAIGVVVGGMAFITALKYAFAAPRPPEAVNAIPIAGFSFPSGHATGATIAYGTLAFDLERWTPRARYAAAAVLVGLIALSRVVLGVHFVRDVVAGVVFGVGFLLLAFALTGHDPQRGFLLAIALAVAALLISDVSRDSVALLGSGLGAAAVWELVDRDPTVEANRWRLALAGVALPLAVGIGYVTLRSGPRLGVVFVVAGVLSAGILGAPLLVKSLR